MIGAAIRALLAKAGAAQGGGSSSLIYNRGYLSDGVNFSRKIRAIQFDTVTYEEKSNSLVNSKTGGGRGVSTPHIGYIMGKQRSGASSNRAERHDYATETNSLTAQSFGVYLFGRTQQGCSSENAFAWGGVRANSSTTDTTGQFVYLQKMNLATEAMTYITQNVLSGTSGVNTQDSESGYSFYGLGNDEAASYRVDFITELQSSMGSRLGGMPITSGAAAESGVEAILSVDRYYVGTSNTYSERTAAFDFATRTGAEFASSITGGNKMDRSSVSGGVVGYFAGGRFGAATYDEIVSCSFATKTFAMESIVLGAGTYNMTGYQG